MPGADPHNLDRFVTAQASVFDVVLDELAACRKRSHWIWFIFPQMRGLGRSSTAQVYGIVSIDEARAYLGHPILGPRLALCTRAVLECSGRSLHSIFGSPDDAKFRSSMTLFAAAAAGEEWPFELALDRMCDGRRDELTLALIQAPKVGKDS